MPRKKKNNKQKPVEGSGAADGGDEGVTGVGNLCNPDLGDDVGGADETPESKKLAQDEILKVITGLDEVKLAGKDKKHNFWDTQPVPNLGESPTDFGPIEVKTVADVSTTPYTLPKSYEWSTCNMNDPAVVDEVYDLLCENYVEDDDNMFRFDYSRAFLRWALQPPGYIHDLHVGVRVNTGKKKLVGFITGIPAHMKVYDDDIKMVEINFLCVHKKLRSKRLAPVLIKEITRRVNLTNVWQAVYTAGVVLPKPVARNRYYHRSLNPKKLIEIGFSRLQQRMTISRLIKLYRLPKDPVTPGIRPMQPKDVPQCCSMLNAYLASFKLRQFFTEEEFSHWLLPLPNVVSSFVVEDPATGKCTDMVSFYQLPSTIIGNDKHSTLKAAYSFYNVSTKTPWNNLMEDALILAKAEDYDVFNALNVMQNDTFLNDLKFGIGDGHLQYYLYNWRCPEMAPGQVGLVLL